jgi:hypothetical protein
VVILFEFVFRWTLCVVLLLSHFQAFSLETSHKADSSSLAKTAKYLPDYFLQQRTQGSSKKIAKNLSTTSSSRILIQDFDLSLAID